MCIASLGQSHAKISLTSELWGQVLEFTQPKDRERCKKVCHAFNQWINHSAIANNVQLNRTIRLWGWLEPVDWTEEWSPSTKMHRFLTSVSHSLTRIPGGLPFWTSLESQGILYSPPGFSALEKFALDANLNIFFQRLIPPRNPLRPLLGIRSNFEALPIPEQAKKIQNTLRSIEEKTPDQDNPLRTRLDRHSSPMGLALLIPRKLSLLIKSLETFELPNTCSCFPEELYLFSSLKKIVVPFHSLLDENFPTAEKLFIHFPQLESISIDGIYISRDALKN